jgi:hypothetical protein
MTAGSITNARLVLPERRAFDAVRLCFKKSKKTLKKPVGSSKRLSHARQWREPAEAE